MVMQLIINTPILLSDNDANTSFKRGIAYLNLHQYSNAIKDFRVAVLFGPYYRAL